MFKLYNSDRASYDAVCRDRAQDFPEVNDFDEIGMYGYAGQDSEDDYSPQKQNMEANSDEGKFGTSLIDDAAIVKRKLA